MSNTYFVPYNPAGWDLLGRDLHAAAAGVEHVPVCHCHPRRHRHLHHSRYARTQYTNRREANTWLACKDERLSGLYTIRKGTNGRGNKCPNSQTFLQTCLRWMLHQITLLLWLFLSDVVCSYDFIQSRRAGVGHLHRHLADSNPHHRCNDCHRYGWVSRLFNYYFSVSKELNY